MYPRLYRSILTCLSAATSGRNVDPVEDYENKELFFFFSCFRNRAKVTWAHHSQVVVYCVGGWLILHAGQCWQFMSCLNECPAGREKWNGHPLKLNQAHIYFHICCYILICHLCLLTQCPLVFKSSTTHRKQVVYWTAQTIVYFLSVCMF